MTVARTPQPTLEQVAAHAGVGRGTASRVINGSAQVSEKSRRAVEAAVAELGYIPNAAARSLVTRRTNAIALVISESEDRIFGEPFFAGVIRGITRAVTASRRQLVLALNEGGDDTGPLERYLTPQHIDGALLLSLHARDSLPELMAAREVPFVLGGRPSDWTGPNYVDVDNRGGARQGTEHLLERGAQVVATITGPTDMAVGQDRLDGYRDALLAAGRPADDSLVVSGDFSETSGIAAARTLLERRPDLDAMFVANDLMAAGALRVLRERGRRVPSDVAVVGFDDSPLAPFTDPPLTTVHQPVEAIGAQMTALLLRQIEYGVDDVSPTILLTSLVLRESA